MLSGFFEITREAAEYSTKAKAIFALLIAFVIFGLLVLSVLYMFLWHKHMDGTVDHTIHSIKEVNGTLWTIWIAWLIVSYAITDFGIYMFRVAKKE